MKVVRSVVEMHPDGCVADPFGLKGVVVGQVDTYAQAAADCQSAIRFHVPTFGEEVLSAQPPVLEASLAEAHAENSPLTHRTVAWFGL